MSNILANFQNSQSLSVSEVQIVYSRTKIILIQSLRDSGRPGCRPGVGDSDSDLSAFHVLRVELEDPGPSLSLSIMVKW